MSNQVPGIATVLVTLMGVTLRRVLRSRAVWVIVVIAMLPVLLAALLGTRTKTEDLTAVAALTVMALLASVFVASSIGEEIEDRTTAYLWSRPLPRWSVVGGKMLALAPIAALLVAGSWALAMYVGGLPIVAKTTLAFAAGGFALSLVAAGIALLVPKHGMSLSIIYLVLVDLIIGGIPASLQAISITHQVWLIARTNEAIATPAISMAIIAGVWFTVGLVRLRRLEV